MPMPSLQPKTSCLPKERKLWSSTPAPTKWPSREASTPRSASRAFFFLFVSGVLTPRFISCCPVSFVSGFFTNRARGTRSSLAPTTCSRTYVFCVCRHVLFDDGCVAFAQHPTRTPQPRPRCRLTLPPSPEVRHFVVKKNCSAHASLRARA